jgi:small subunit ribosomal protein S16
MSVALRFKRVGKPKHAQYRLVAIDRRQRSQGTPIEVLGHYDPKQGPKTMQVNLDRFQHWLKVGAQPSESVRGAMKCAGLWQKIAPVKVSSKAPSKASA